MKTISSTTLISFSLLINPTNASTIYSDQGLWRILQVHETFSFDKRHSHCSAYRTLGDRTLFIDVDRKFIEDFKSITDNMMTLRYFDSSFSEEENEASQTVSLRIDDEEIGSTLGYHISYGVGNFDDMITHSPYVLAIVDKDTFSLDIKDVGAGAASIIQGERPTTNSQYIISGIQVQLGLNEGVEITEREGTIQIGRFSQFPLEGVTGAVETLIECNRNVIAAEINLQNAVETDEINDPFELIIQHNLPSTEQNLPIFRENLDNLIKAYAPSTSKELSEFWSDQKAANQGYGADGTLRVWSGEASFGRLYYNPYVFDDLRKRKSNDFLVQCLVSGGDINQTGIKQTKELGLIGNEQILWCNGSDGDEKSHVMHFLYSIFSEFDGASIGIEDSILLDMDRQAMREIWNATTEDYPPYTE